MTELSIKGLHFPQSYSNGVTFSSFRGKENSRKWEFNYGKTCGFVVLIYNNQLAIQDDL